MDSLIHGIAGNGSIRFVSAVTTNSVAEAVRRHKTSPTVAAALGRVMTGALLLASGLKDYDNLTIRFESNGAIGGVTAESDGHGHIRGYVKNPDVDLPIRADGKLDVGGIVGSGMLYVIRETGAETEMFREPYVGSVEIVTGEIGEDIAHYLLKSEQIPSAVMLGVYVTPYEPYIDASGGVMIQVLPGANEHIITMIEDTIRHAPNLTDSVRGGATPEDLIKIALGIIDYEILGKSDVCFRCSCSKEKAAEILATVSKTDISEMAEKDGGAKLDCGYCGEIYEFSVDELNGLYVGK